MKATQVTFDNATYEQLKELHDIINLIKSETIDSILNWTESTKAFHYYPLSKPSWHFRDRWDDSKWAGE